MGTGGGEYRFGVDADFWSGRVDEATGGVAFEGEPAVSGVRAGLHKMDRQWARDPSPRWRKRGDFGMTPAENRIYSPATNQSMASSRVLKVGMSRWEKVLKFS